MCQAVDPKVIFKGSKVMVSQASKKLILIIVILSLMHQISLDLFKNTGLKLSWLQECAINLVRSDPIISEHVPKILGTVHKRLQDFLNKLDDPNAPHFRTAKMLLLMTFA